MSMWRAGAAVTVGDVTIVPIDQVSVRSHRMRSLIWLFAAKEPVAVVVRGPQGTQALDLEGQRLPLDELARKVPGLERVLALS
jgi:hypothetical protein